MATEKPINGMSWEDELQARQLSYSEALNMAMAALGLTAPTPEVEVLAQSWTTMPTELVTTSPTERR